MSANSHYARVSGIGPVTLATPLTALFAKIVKQPLPAFLDSIAAIAAAGYIPGVMGAARCTLDAAKDAKTFGSLKGDVLSVDEVVRLLLLLLCFLFCLPRLCPIDSNPPSS